MSAESEQGTAQPAAPLETEELNGFCEGGSLKKRENSDTIFHVFIAILVAYSFWSSIPEQYFFLPFLKVSFPFLNVRTPF